MKYFIEYIWSIIKGDEIGKVGWGICKEFFSVKLKKFLFYFVGGGS